MMRRTTVLPLVLISLSLALSSPLPAATIPDPASPNPLTGPVNLQLPQLDAAPALADFAGMAPASALARSMAKVDSFVQRLPADGTPPSQRTEVYLGYDQETLYAVFLAFDSQPGLIRANLSSRENISGDDSVELTIDTFNDQRTAYTFQVTPLGIQWDARWTEGASTRAGFDTTWEAVWDSEGEMTDQGYMVRIAVPLASLRFPDASEQLWRVQAGRQIPRLSEQVYWPAYSLRLEGRLNQTALLTGIHDVAPGSSSLFIPYIFSRAADALDTRAPGGPQIANDKQFEVGIDTKFVFNDAWVLDLTLNPDFSQVESDEPQVTVNERFEVLFPERRPFFVENADFFATESNLVFTRRIVDPDGGLRFTGRSNGWGFGTILMNDVAPGLNRDAGDPLRNEKAKIGILRGFRDLAGQNRVGMLYSDRQLAEGFNRVASVDGRVKLNSNWVTNLQVIGTDTRPLTGGATYTGAQRNFRLDRTGRTLSTHIHHVETNPGFVTDLGFQGRYYKADTAGTHGNVNLKFYPERSRLNSWGPTLSTAHQEDSSGTRIYAEVSPSLAWNFATSQISIGLNDYTEVLRADDFAGLNTTQRYDYDSWNVTYNNSMLQSVILDASYRRGTALNLVPVAGLLPEVADTDRIDLTLLWRPIDRLRVNTTYLNTGLTSRTGAGSAFNNEILRSTWNYQFTREMSLRLIGQYDNTDAGPASRLTDRENLNLDVLLRYVINPWSAFYVGYNSNSRNFDIVETETGRELITTSDLQQDGEQFFIKFSYMLQR